MNHFSFFPFIYLFFLYIFAAMRLCNFILIKNLFFFVNFIHVCNIFCQFIPTPLWDLPTHPLLTSCDPPTPSLSLSGSLSPMRASAGKFTDVVLILCRSCTGDYSCSEFMSTEAMSHLDDSISQCSSPSSSSYLFFPLFHDALWALVFLV